jgi:Na+/H+ antiporter NhaC
MKSMIIAVIIFFMGISFIQAQEESGMGELIINFENRPAS